MLAVGMIAQAAAVASFPFLARLVAGAKEDRGRPGHDSLAPHDGGGLPCWRGSVLGGERSSGQDRISMGGLR